MKYEPGQTATFLMHAHVKRGVRCTILEQYGRNALNYTVRLEEAVERMQAGHVYIAGISQLKPRIKVQADIRPRDFP